MGAIVEWSWRQFGPDDVTHFSIDEDSTALDQGGVVTSLPPTTSSVAAYVQLWPSIDSFGHHRVSCVRTGTSGRRRCTLESEAARVYREAGERVTKNAMIRDLDLPVSDVTDSRR